MRRYVPIKRAGQTQPDLVQGVVMIDAVSGEPVAAGAGAGAGWVQDSTGQPFDLASCALSAVLNADDLPATVTATLGARAWVRTYSYSPTGAFTGHGQWVPV
jgi:hypothetical protein